MTTLSDLSPGQSARVLSVDARTLSGARMLEMGITPGAQVRLVGSAPLGDPVEVEVLGYRLSLRRKEAALARVELIDESGRVSP